MIRNALAELYQKTVFHKHPSYLLALTIFLLLPWFSLSTKKGDVTFCLRLNYSVATFLPILSNPCASISIIECGGLKESCPNTPSTHFLTNLKTGSELIKQFYSMSRRCDFLEGRVSISISSLCFQFSDKMFLSADAPIPGLLPSVMLPTMMVKDLPSETLSKCPIRYSILQVVLVMAYPQ